MATVAIAAPVPRCAAIDAHSLPDPGSCQRRFDSMGFDALYASADANIKAGHFAQAELALGCAAARLVDKNDGMQRYEWIRRRGVLAYRQERIADALGHFECALGMAEKRNDRVAVAKQLKNVGSALRRIGDYRDALLTLERGLRMMRDDGDPAIGGMLANIADVYRELGETRQAERYYRQAEAAHRRNGDIVEAAHVVDSLSALALQRGDPDMAARMLEGALQDLRNEKDRRYQLGLYASLAEAAIANGDVELASRHSANGLAVADQYNLPIPPSLQLQAARADRMRGRIESARIRLQAALAKTIDSDADRAALMEELATTLQQNGRDTEAIAILREAQAAERRELSARSDRQLAWLRTRFESAENERTIVALRQRTLLLWLAVVTTLSVLLAFSLLFVRRQQRARVDEAASRARYEEMISRYRREADALSGDRDLLQTLLDSREDAVCLLDAEGQILAANRAACRLLGTVGDIPMGRAVMDAFAEHDRMPLLSALERMEDNAVHTLDFVTCEGIQLSAQLTQWKRGDGLVVMGLCERNALPSHDFQAQVEAASTTTVGMMDRATGDARIREGFRHALVDLMLAVVDTWERTTGSNRLELAEKSRIWRVNIDDGRLRARAMERYLAVSKLPQNPRWRDVLRSAYFVLTQCAMEPHARESLQYRIDAVLAYTRGDPSV